MERRGFIGGIVAGLFGNAMPAVAAPEPTTVQDLEVQTLDGVTHRAKVRFRRSEEAQYQAKLETIVANGVMKVKSCNATNDAGAVSIAEMDAALNLRTPQDDIDDE
jgi:hypothetical protein